jgi:hypothetical protein
MELNDKNDDSLKRKESSLYDATRKQAYSLRFLEEHIPGILHRALLLVSLTSCLTRPLRATGRLSLSSSSMFFLTQREEEGETTTTTTTTKNESGEEINIKIDIPFG